MLYVLLILRAFATTSLSWPAVVEDIEVTLGIIRDTNGEEVTLEFINKKEEVRW